MPRTSPRNSTRNSTRTSREQPVARERRGRRRARPAFGVVLNPIDSTLPGSATASFVYGSGSANAYADEASRLQRVEISSVSVVEYDYLGTASVIGVEYPQPAVFQRKYGSTSGTWPDLDRFGRVVNSRWTKDLSTDMDFVSMQLTYDENSNPLTADEGIYATGFPPLWGVKYSIDGLDRLTDAEEGTLSGSTIATQTRRQQWTLSRTGNWDAETRDMNGAGAGYGANGLTETRTHNIVNELTGRSVTTDGGGPTSRTLSHDAAGNLPHPWVGDGQDYEYVYDAWHRLVRIEVRSSADIVSEHRYYGNGFRAGERYDSNEDGRVNSSDKWYWFGYDERWRIVGTFRDSDSSPKERFLHHVAGMGGYGSSSYIDDLVLRDRDANTDWNDDASDGTLEERIYYCQNWRHDVVALVTSGGALRERVRYTAYGIPVGMPQGDCDGDGDVDAADQSILLGAWGTATAKCDLNLDGTVDATDNAILLGQLGATAGFGRLSLSGNRFGYAGYASDPAVHADWHVRHRVLMAGLGRWPRRDPIGYADSESLYVYGSSHPVSTIDPTGLHPYLGPSHQSSPTCEGMIHTNCWLDPIWGPLLQAARHAVRQSCGGREPNWSCSTCAGNPGLQGAARPWCSAWGRGFKIIVCDGAVNPCQTLLHELIHARQFCDEGLFTGSCEKFWEWMADPLDCIVSEMEAYGGSLECHTNNSCCRRACGSCSGVWHTAGHGQTVYAAFCICRAWCDIVYP